MGRELICQFEKKNSLKSSGELLSSEPVLCTSQVSENFEEVN